MGCLLRHQCIKTWMCARITHSKLMLLLWSSLVITILFFLGVFFSCFCCWRGCSYLHNKSHRWSKNPEQNFVYEATREYIIAKWACVTLGEDNWEDTWEGLCPWRRGYEAYSRSVVKSYTKINWELHVMARCINFHISGLSIENKKCHVCHIDNRKYDASPCTLQT